MSSSVRCHYFRESRESNQHFLTYPLTTVPNPYGLRSAARADLVVSRTRLQLGNRAFRVAGPVAWNSLPQHIRSSPTLSTFKNTLFSRSSSLTNCFAEYEQRTLYGALVVSSDSSHVIAPYKFTFYYYYY